MMEFEGVVEKVYSSEGTKKDGTAWKRTVYMINGKQFATFTDLGFKQGDRVKVDYRQDGKFNNINTGVVLEGQPNIKKEVVESKLKIKIIKGANEEAFEQRYNKFAEKNDINYTQTHVSVIGKKQPFEFRYIAYVYYR